MSAIAAVAASEAFALIGTSIAALAVVALAGSLNLDTKSAIAVEETSPLPAEVVLLTKSDILDGSNTPSAVLVALVAAVSVLELLEVSVAVADASNSLDISGVASLVCNATVVAIVMLVSKVVVVGTMVPRSKVVSPTAISPIGIVLVSEGVVSWGVVEGVAAKSNHVADIARCVLVALVSDTSLLLAVVLVVVAGDGVKSDIDFARVVAPLVVNSFLGVPVVVGAPLVPGIVDPLVVALALMATLSVRVVSINELVTVEALVTLLLVTIVLVVSSVAYGLSLLRLDTVAMRLLVGTIGALLIAVIELVILKPGVNRSNTESEDERFEHFF